MASSSSSSPMCRLCRIPLVPPDPNRRYRTIKCEKCRETTPVGPAPEDKKYVVCSCNALLVVDDDASLFTCTRCNKIRTAVELVATGTIRNQASSSNSLFQTYTDGTIRKSIQRSVTAQQVSTGKVAASREAKGTVNPKSAPNPKSADIEADDLEKVKIRMNEDQVLLAHFFGDRLRPFVTTFLNSNHIWWMRLKVLLWVCYNVVVSVLILSNFLEQEFKQQFGFDTFDTWLALVLFVPYILCFCIEWIFNKIIIYGYILLCLWYSVFACVDSQKRAFFWNFYDLGHLLDEVMYRAFYLRIPRLQVPVYRFFNPPSNTQIESEFFYLSDVHLMSLVFKHPRINFFFKFCVGFSIVAKIYGRVGCVLAIIFLPFNQYTIFYAAETFLALIWMLVWYLVTDRN